MTNSRLEKTPAVSIVMSVYNGADSLERALTEIAGQTFADYELIVVDDGSTDATAEILDRWAVADVRLRVIKQANQGLTRALIRGCAAARGEFIARHDSDDTSHPERLARQVGLLRAQPEVGFVSCATSFVGPGGEFLFSVERPSDSGAATERLLWSREGPPAHGSVTFRKSLYDRTGGYRPEFYFGQDSDLWLRMAEQSRVAYLPDVLYSAAYSAAGISGRYRHVQREYGRLAKECQRLRESGESEEPALCSAEELADEVRSGKAAKSRPWVANYFIGSLLLDSDPPSARSYLRECVRQRPTHLKAWWKLWQSRGAVQRAGQVS